MKLMIKNYEPKKAVIIPVRSGCGHGYNQSVLNVIKNPK